MNQPHPFHIGDWVEPSPGLQRATGLKKQPYRVEDTGFDQQYEPPLSCVKVGGFWVYAADCYSTAPPPPTLAEKEVAAQAEDGWRRRRDEFLRGVFSDR